MINDDGKIEKLFGKCSRVNLLSHRRFASRVIQLGKIYLSSSGKLSQKLVHFRIDLLQISQNLQIFRCVTRLLNRLNLVYLVYYLNYLIINKFKINKCYL